MLFVDPFSPFNHLIMKNGNVRGWPAKSGETHPQKKQEYFLESGGFAGFG
jgi:hypothetical protein